MLAQRSTISPISARLVAREFTSRVDRMAHIAARLEAGWRLRLGRDGDGQAFARLDHGRIFRLSERIDLPAGEFAFYESRQRPGRFFC